MQRQSPGVADLPSGRRQPRANSARRYSRTISDHFAGPCCRPVAALALTSDAAPGTRLCWSRRALLICICSMLAPRHWRLRGKISRRTKRQLSRQQRCRNPPVFSLDFAFSLGVLHHVPDTQQAICSIAEKLKPSAPLLIDLYYALDNRPSWHRLGHDRWRACHRVTAFSPRANGDQRNDCRASLLAAGAA